ncbi:MAG TPA: ABC transporter permease [Gemmatimonadaceae bacterium]|nr:ABC transporter permease [Gemmatimonadaceae bacterium]
MNAPRFRRLLRLPLFRARPEDIDAEIAFHLETRAEQFVRRGMSRNDAMAEARRRFGITSERDLDVIRGDLRRSAARRERHMSAQDRLETLARDARYALRNVRNRPGFTAAIVLTLALGIGATTAIFSVVQAVILRPLPYADADRMAMIWTHWTNWPRTWLSGAEYYDYVAQTDVFQSVSAFSTGAANISGGEGDPERVNAGYATASIFDVTATRPMLGRPYTRVEDVPNGPRVILLGEDFWRRRFAANPAIIGTPIQVNGASVLVIGVMPAAFRLPTQFAGDRADVFLPLQLGPPREDDRGSHYLNAVARLRPGVTLDQAQSRISTFIERFKVEHPNTYGPEFGVTLVSMADQVRGDIRPILLVLLGAVSFVLLIACTNVANLLLSRAETRHREIAVRTALGASNGRIAAQLLTESVVLSLAGGVLGVVIATGVTRALSRANLANLPRVDDLRIDAGVLAFAAAVAVLTGLLFGLAPVLHTMRAIGGTLKEGRGNTSDRNVFRMRSALIAAEIMLAVVATAGAVLMTRSFARLLSVSPGFVPDRALSFRLSAPAAKYADSRAVRDLFERVTVAVHAIPGVQAVGGVTALPLQSELGDWGVSIEGVPPAPPGKEGPAIDWISATPGYLDALGTPILRGRPLLDSDRRDAEPVMIINDAARRKYFADRDPLGLHIRLGGIADTVWRRVVGIMADIRHSGLDKDVRPQMIIPYAQFLATLPDSLGNTPRALTIVARTSGDPASITSAVRGAIRAIDPDLPLAQVRTLSDVFARSVSTPRMVTLLLGSFGMLALLLSAIGVYGVTAYGVARRRNEIGIRIALGARVRDVVRLIVAQGMRPAVVGVVLGVALAVAGTRLMQNFLYGVRPTDAVSLIAAPVALLLVGAAANWIPARRAASVDPVSALRAD